MEVILVLLLGMLTFVGLLGACLFAITAVRGELA
jgi:hypothetical protein